MTDDLDALRRFDEDEDLSFDEAMPGLDFDTPVRDEPRFLGMTAVERMFISIFLFLNVLILGLGLLLATGRIRF